ncbi:MAG: SpoIIE family protein phosphatase [Merdibacter sp.]
MNTLYRSDFHLEHLKDSRLFYRSTGFVLDSAAKLQVQAAYDSISVQKQENGDTCSIFHHDVHTLCTLSDGMGSGAEAAKSSALITGVLQRMIASDMEIVAAVKTVNRLIHSDVYATLDVICVNAHTQKAYLVKSAACPTLLIRQGHLLQLDGRSLPVGMLEEIEPDCMELQLQTGDEILMVSDGVRMQEIRTWLHARKEGEVQEELAALMRLLRQCPREDDTTALLLRLQKAERSMTKGNFSYSGGKSLKFPPFFTFCDDCVRVCAIRLKRLRNSGPCTIIRSWKIWMVSNSWQETLGHRRQRWR